MILLTHTFYSNENVALHLLVWKSETFKPVLHAGRYIGNGLFQLSRRTKKSKSITA